MMGGLLLGSHERVQEECTGKVQGGSSSNRSIWFRYGESRLTVGVFHAIRLTRHCS